METPSNTVQLGLIKLYRKFCSYVVETNPNYVDADFSFDNFMAFLDLEEDSPTALD